MSRSINDFFKYEQHFYKQRQAEISKKNKQILSKTLMLSVILQN